MHFHVIVLKVEHTDYMLSIATNVPCINGNGALYILLNTIGLLDSLVGLIIIYVGGSIPMNAFLVKGYFDTLPQELDESAKWMVQVTLDLFQILLPLLNQFCSCCSIYFMSPLWISSTTYRIT